MASTIASGETDRDRPRRIRDSESALGSRAARAELPLRAVLERRPPRRPRRADARRPDSELGRWRRRAIVTQSRARRGTAASSQVARGPPGTASRSAESRALGRARRDPRGGCGRRDERRTAASAPRPQPSPAGFPRPAAMAAPARPSSGRIVRGTGSSSVHGSSDGPRALHATLQRRRLHCARPSAARPPVASRARSRIAPSVNAGPIPGGGAPRRRAPPARSPAMRNRTCRQPATSRRSSTESPGPATGAADRREVADALSQPGHRTSRPGSAATSRIGKVADLIVALGVALPAGDRPRRRDRPAPDLPALDVGRRPRSQRRAAAHLDDRHRQVPPAPQRDPPARGPHGQADRRHRRAQGRPRQRPAASTRSTARTAWWRSTSARPACCAGSASSGPTGRVAPQPAAARQRALHRLGGRRPGRDLGRVDQAARPARRPRGAASGRPRDDHRPARPARPRRDHRRRSTTRPPPRRSRRWSPRRRSRSSRTWRRNAPPTSSRR